ARDRPRVAIARPPGGSQLRDVFADRERIPDVHRSVHQNGNPTARPVLFDLLLEFGRIQRDQHLIESDAQVLQQYPGTQRPGGVVLVADDQREWGHARIIRFVGSPVCPADQFLTAPERSRLPRSCCRRYVGRRRPRVSITNSCVASAAARGMSATHRRVWMITELLPPVEAVITPTTNGPPAAKIRPML